MVKVVQGPGSPAPAQPLNGPAPHLLSSLLLLLFTKRMGASRWWKLTRDPAARKSGKCSFQTPSSPVTTGMSWGASRVERWSYPVSVLTVIVGNGINRFPKFESRFPSLGKGGLLRCCCIFFKILVGSFHAIFKVGWPCRCESCLDLVSEVSRDRLEIIFFCSVE